MGIERVESFDVDVDGVTGLAYYISEGAGGKRSTFVWDKSKRTRKRLNKAMGIGELYYTDGPNKRGKNKFITLWNDPDVGDVVIENFNEQVLAVPQSIYDRISYFPGDPGVEGVDPVPPGQPSTLVFVEGTHNIIARIWSPMDQVLDSMQVYYY